MKHVSFALFLADEKIPTMLKYSVIAAAMRTDGPGATVRVGSRYETVLPPDPTDVYAAMSGLAGDKRASEDWDTCQ